MKRLLLLLTLGWLYASPTQAQLTPTPWTGGPLRVSANQRYLVHADGQPFFYLGDTAWELFHRLNRDEAEYYLRHRAEQGFTVVQAVALAELNGLNDPNPYGQKPLLNNDPTTPNPAYFEHVDWIIDKARSLGIAVALLPTWGDKLFKNTWGDGPEIFNADNARTYGRWIGSRYRTRDNIIWVLGGDRTPREGSADVAVWRAMADGIQEGVGGADNALMTFHPQPNSVTDGGAGRWFQADTWFDFNMHQTGHCRDTPVYDYLTTSYNRQPTKPTMDAEPIYEDHPVCFNAKALGISNALDVRKSVYLALFAGAHGQTYGCHNVWQLYAPGRTPVNGAHMSWKEALDLPAASQMRFVRQLLTSRPLLERVPDQSLIRENNYPSAERIQATRGRTYAFVYSSAGRPFTLLLGKTEGKQITAAWFDPRTGQSKPIGTYPNTGEQRFSPPTSGYGQDWVLTVDSGQ